MYKNLSGLYDTFMEDVPYNIWLENIEHYLKKYSLAPKTVLDLGCGTGQITVLLCEKGYDVTGADISEEMLSVAYDKALKAGVNPFFICQDMRELTLPAPYDLIVSLCDCINYITNKNDLKKVFKNCRAALNKNGLFIFDLNTPYKLREILGDNTFCQTTDTAAFTCENCFDEETGICEYYLNLFSQNPDLTYSRYEEFHYERAYETEEITALLREAGLKLLEIADAETLDSPTETTERIYYIARKED